MAEQHTDDHQDAASATGGSTLGRVDLIYAALALISVLPALLVRYPESVDYLNHLARLYVLTAPPNDPVHAVYRVHWHLIPNLGLELLAMPLATLLPLEAVMRIVWAICILGMAAGLWFLHRALFARTQPTLVLGAIALINMPLTIGLMNFTLGLAMALVAVGFWFRLGDRATPRSILMLNLFSAVILVTHVAACASLALTIGALQFLRRPFTVTAMTRRAVIVATGFALPALIMIFITLSRAAPADVTGAESGGVGYSWLWKLQLPIAPIFTGISVTDAIGAFILWAALLTAWRDGGTCYRRLVAPLLIWLVTLLALPFAIGSATVIDLRQAIFPAMLLVAAVACAPQKRALSTAIIAVGIVGVLARTVLVMPEWRRHDADVASFRAMGSAVERGARVLVATAPTAPGVCPEPHRWAPFDEHTAAVLTIDRAAFVSTVFAKPDVQPIEPVAALRDIAIPDLGIVPFVILVSNPGMTAEQQKAADAAAAPWRVYRRDWRKNYDYLALRRINCPVEIPPQPDLVPVAESSTYRLYRIIHATP